MRIRTAAAVTAATVAVVTCGGGRASAQAATRLRDGVGVAAGGRRRRRRRRAGHRTCGPAGTPASTGWWSTWPDRCGRVYDARYVPSVRAGGLGRRPCPLRGAADLQLVRARAGVRPETRPARPTGRRPPRELVRTSGLPHLPPGRVGGQLRGPDARSGSGCGRGCPFRVMVLPGPGRRLARGRGRRPLLVSVRGERRPDRAQTDARRPASVAAISR